jgi:phage-related protein
MSKKIENPTNWEMRAVIRFMKAQNAWNGFFFHFPLKSRRTVRVLAGQFVALQNSWVIVSLDV